MWDKGERIGKMLVNMGLVDEAQVQGALSLSSENGKSLGQNMFELGHVTDSSTLQLLVAQGAASPWFLGTALPETRIIRLLSPSVMREHMLVPIVRLGDLLLLAMEKPNDHLAMERVRALTGLRIESVEADPERIKGLIETLLNEERAKQPTKESKKAAAAAAAAGAAPVVVEAPPAPEPPVAAVPPGPLEVVDIDELLAQDAIKFEKSALPPEQPVVELPTAAQPAAEPEPAPARLTFEHEVVCSDDTAPVAGLVDQVFADSVRRNASEILVESNSEGMGVRYRVDGRLRSIGDIPKSLAPLVEARLRLMASLDILPSGVPQTGTVRYEMSSRAVEFDASFTPTVYGTRVLLRARVACATVGKLEDLGLAKSELALVRDALESSAGMLLVVAPTPMERSRSLYSLVADLASPARDIMTCEEVTGASIAGVSHSKFVHRNDRSRAEHLTTILKQASDVVMVDLLSDDKVATTAVRAALSGHLIIAGLESKNALGAIARLTELGIDPYLASSALNGILAQRQVRTLCQACKKQDGEKWRSVGCGECEGTGYAGTVDVFEFLPMTDEIRRLISEKAPLADIEVAATKAGYRPMANQAQSKVERGETDERELESTFRRPLADTGGARPMTFAPAKEEPVAPPVQAAAPVQARKGRTKGDNFEAEAYREQVKKEREEMNAIFNKQPYELESGYEEAA